MGWLMYTAPSRGAESKETVCITSLTEKISIVKPARGDKQILMAEQCKTVTMRSVQKIITARRCCSAHVPEGFNAQTDKPDAESKALVRPLWYNALEVKAYP